jgi:hypothetical protein
MLKNNRLSNITTLKVGPATFSVRFNLIELGSNLINRILATSVDQRTNSKTIDSPTTRTKNNRKAKTKH